MCGVTAGLLNKQIGINLGVSEMTVKSHRGAAMRKMYARSLADLVRMADAIGEEAVPVKSGRLIRVPRFTRPDAVRDLGPGVRELPLRSTAFR